MNQKELNELRRRFRLDKNNFSRVTLPNIRWALLYGVVLLCELQP
mgnify:CR=1 FL=1